MYRTKQAIPLHASVNAIPSFESEHPASEATPTIDRHYLLIEVICRARVTQSRYRR